MDHYVQYTDEDDVTIYATVTGGYVPRVGETVAFGDHSGDFQVRSVDHYIRNPGGGQETLHAIGVVVVPR